jgi:hypothetical protein
MLLELKAGFPQAFAESAGGFYSVFIGNQQ